MSVPEGLCLEGVSLQMSPSPPPPPPVDRQMLLKILAALGGHEGPPGPNYYRLQRSWAKVIFSQACVKNSVHRGEGVCLSACWDTPPGADTPPTRQPPQTPLDQADTTPQTRQTPPWEADSSIRSTSSRYASYWNAFLFQFHASGFPPVREIREIFENIFQSGKSGKKISNQGNFPTVGRQIKSSRNVHGFLVWLYGAVLLLGSVSVMNWCFFYKYYPMVSGGHI